MLKKIWKIYPNVSTFAASKQTKSDTIKSINNKKRERKRK